MTLENAGAGHRLPTTPTPAIFVEAGEPPRVRRIGRHISFTGGRFVEHADTRIAPGERVELAFPIDGGARAARVRVTVAPDEYYERFYAELLARKQPPAARRELETALRVASSSRYVLYDLTASRRSPRGPGPSAAGPRAASEPPASARLP